MKNFVPFFEQWEWLRTQRCIKQLQDRITQSGCFSFTSDPSLSTRNNVLSDVPPTLLQIFTHLSSVKKRLLTNYEEENIQLTLHNQAMKPYIYWCQSNTWKSFDYDVQMKKVLYVYLVVLTIDNLPEVF